MLLRRDSRIKERRKYGLKKARKASQFLNDNFLFINKKFLRYGKKDLHQEWHQTKVFVMEN